MMIRRPPRSTRTHTLFPYATLVRSHAVDRGVVLVVRAHGCQREYRPLARRAGAVPGQDGRDGMGDEGGAAAGGVQASFAGSVRQAEAAGHAPAGAEVVEVVEHVRDRSEARRVGKEGVSTC